MLITFQTTTIAYSSNKNLSFKQNSDFLEHRLQKLQEMGEQKIENEYIQEQFSKLTEEEQKVLSKYSTLYRMFNETLRKNLNDKSALKKIKALDEIINKTNPLKEEKIVYRAIDENLAQEYISNLCSGKIAEDKAFLSTGTDAKLSEFKYFAGLEDSFILRIRLPKGTKGACIKELEYVLPRNSKLKLINFDKDLKIADVEYILPIEDTISKSKNPNLVKYGTIAATTALGLYGLFWLYNKKNDIKKFGKD